MTGFDVKDGTAASPANPFAINAMHRERQENRKVRAKFRWSATAGRSQGAVPEALRGIESSFNGV
jgi:hypothetical protein